MVRPDDSKGRWSDHLYGGNLMADIPSVYVMMPMREAGTNLVSWLAVEEVAARREKTRLRAIVAWHVVSARNEIARELLRTDYEYVLMVDDDTTIPLDTIERLLAVKADIATGVTPIVRVGVLMANIASKDLPSKCARPPHMADLSGLLVPSVHDIELCGLSCVLIHRRVFETLGFPWFDWLEDERGNVDSEDMLFCRAAREAGFTIRADTGLICGHHKTIDLRRLVCRDNGGPVTLNPHEASTIDPYATHMPMLLACLAHSSGPVLELGCGAYSTPVLSEVCRLQGRRLVSADNNRAWYERLANTFNGTHEVVHVADWNYSKLQDQHWGMVLVDHSPANQRVIDARRLAKAGAEFIVMHDTDKPEFYGYEVLFDEFKHHYTYKTMEPWTTVFSNSDNWPAAWSTP